MLNILIGIVIGFLICYYWKDEKFKEKVNGWFSKKNNKKD